MQMQQLSYGTLLHLYFFLYLCTGKSTNTKYGKYKDSMERF